MLKRLCAVLTAVGILLFIFTACSGKETPTTSDDNRDESAITEDAPDYVGEYVRTGDVGEVTFTVSEDGSFEMVMTGQVNQTVSGRYKLEVTNSPDVVKLSLHPNKNIVDGEELEIAENATGTATIEGDTLTMAMESQDTVFKKK